jgi:TPR repeat protein
MTISPEKHSNRSDIQTQVGLNEAPTNKVNVKILREAYNGNSDAQLKMAQHYSPFNGLKSKNKLAMKWYKKAAAQNHPSAQFHLASMYEEGLGCALDLNRALYWYEQAALHNHIESQYRIALLYKNAHQNNAQALVWLHKVIEGDVHHVDAMYQIAYIYNFDTFLNDNEQAFKWYNMAALEENDKRSFFELYWFYKTGKGNQPQNNDMALECLEISADQGYRSALFELAVCYETGDLVENMDLKKAYELYEESVSSTSIGVIKPLAYYKLGMLHNKEHSQDTEKAFDYFYKAAQLNVSEAHIELAHIYNKTEIYSLAFRYYTKAKNIGDPHGMYYVGTYYERGVYVGQDYKMAIDHYEKAAELGHLESQYRLAQIYSLGQGARRNTLKAFEYYAKSASLGHPQSLYEVGLRYMLGQSVEQSYEKSFVCVKESAQSGYPEAQYKLGWMYEIGVGIEINEKDASHWYLEAAKQEHVLAQYSIGKMCEMGKGIQQDYKQSYQWYLKASNHENADAQYRIALLYQKGYDQPNDDFVVFEWIKRAAINGNVDAQVLAGYMYHIGKGVSVNYQKAFEWYTIAASKGNKTACYNLSSMYKNGQGIEKDYSKAREWYNMASLHEQNDTEYRAEEIDELKQSLYPNHETTMQRIQHTSDQNEPEEESKINSMITLI